MRGRTVCGATAAVVGILIFAGGLAHSAVGLPDIRRSVETGDIRPHLAPQQLVGWAFGGTAMNVFGILLLLQVRELRKGRRAAWRVAMVIGSFYVLFGLGALAYRFPNPHFFAFSTVGAALCVPLAIWHREYRGD